MDRTHRKMERRIDNLARELGLDGTQELDFRQILTESFEQRRRAQDEAREKLEGMLSDEQFAEFERLSGDTAKLQRARRYRLPEDEEE